MSQVVSHQLHTVKDKVQSPASPRGVSGGQSGTDLGFLAELQCFLVNVIPIILHTTHVSMTDAV
jgi:hypothetical protein